MFYGRLTYEVIEFLFNYGIFDTPVNLEEIKNVENGLKDPAFVERLIGLVMTSGNKIMTFAEAKALYSKLNDLRYDPEYQEDIKRQEKK
jgi:hypothetical protein